MTHYEAMAARLSPHPLDPFPPCKTELDPVGKRQVVGGQREIFRCPHCGIYIATLQGAPHWSNFVVAGGI